MILTILAISRAWKTLESDDTRAKCLDVVEEAKAKVDANVRGPNFVSHFTSSLVLYILLIGVICVFC